METLRAELEAGKAAMRAVFDPVLAHDDPIPNSENPAWTVRDTLAHLVAAEKGMRRMVEIMVAKGGYHFKPYDRDGLNAERIAEQASLSAQDLLAQWCEARDQTLALWDRLTAEQLALEGSEPHWGAVTIQGVFDRAVAHTAAHLAEIQSSLGQTG